MPSECGGANLQISKNKMCRINAIITEELRKLCTVAATHVVFVAHNVPEC